MYTLKIVDGDLAVRGDGSIEQSEGARRIEQELACWILEPLGSDKMYPRFGSKMGSFIGAPSLESELLQVRAEVVRIVNNYIANQKQQIEKYKSGSSQDFMNSWKDDDIIASVGAIDVTAVADTVKVDVSLSTAAGRIVNVSQTL